MSVLQEMGSADGEVLLEMNKAHEASAFLSSTMTRLKNLPTNPTQVFNIADGFVRRIIKVAKQLEFFRRIDKDDQIALLKGSVVEIMMLRSAVNFNPHTETWSLSTQSCIKLETSTAAPSPSCSHSSSGSSVGSPGGLDLSRLREAAMKGADLATLRQMARQTSNMSTASSASEASDTSRDTCGPRNDVDSRRNSYITPSGGGGAGIDLSAMRDRYLAGQGGAGRPVDLSAVRERLLGDKPRVEKCHSDASSPAISHDPEMDGLRNAATAAGFDIEALRKAAMGGASFEQLSQMAHAGMAARGSSEAGDSGIPTGKEDDPPKISSEILKLGNSESRSMFLTYSKFIRSLMTTIYGDVIVLKFMIMLSLFSPDRQGIQNAGLVEGFQQKYAESLKRYLEVRFPTEKNMFAKCIMKLTDLRNVNEVHTKMLLKMHVEDIEPLLVEIFDLPQ